MRLLSSRTVGALAVALTTTIPALAGVPLQVAAKLKVASVEPGESVELLFHVDVPVGHHLYAPGTPSATVIEVYRGGARTLQKF